MIEPKMLTDDTLALITAAVDGELTPDEARRLAWVFDESEEAHELHARVKADSDSLRLAPRAVPPAGLARRIMDRVAAVAPPVLVFPSRTTPAARRARPSRPWVPAAVAAGLLLGVATGSYWFFSHPGTSDRHPTARNDNRPPPATRSGAGDPAWSKWLPHDPARPPSGPGTDPDRPVAPGPVDSHPPSPHPAVPVTVAVAPEPRTHRPDFITAPPGPDNPSFDLVRARVPFLRSLADFDREDARQQLAEELGRDPAFRVDLFARDPGRGVQFLQSAAKRAGVVVFADATTLDRLQKRQVGTVVLYTESLTAAELADLFARLQAEDAKISPRVFDQLHATPVVAAEERGLREVLGLDVGLFKRPGERPDREKPPEPGKSLGAGTADHIVKSVTSPAAGKPAEKTAVLLTWAPSTARTLPAASQELKQYLAKRGDRKENAIPVLIVIRPGNG